MNHTLAIALILAAFGAACAGLVLYATRFGHGRNCRCRDCWDRNLAETQRQAAAERQRNGGAS